MDSLYLLYPPLIFALYIFTKHILNKIQNLPPSPFLTLPILGHLYFLKKPLHRTLSQVSARYGPVVLLRFGSRPVLIVSSPSAAEECLSKNDIVFANRPRLLAGKHIGYNYTSLAWAPYGDHWRNLRRISSIEILSSNRLQMLSDIRADEIRSAIRRIHRTPMDQAVDMKVVLFELMLNVMMRMIAGKRYYAEEVADLEAAVRFREIVEETFRLATTNVEDFLPIVGWGGVRGSVKRMRDLQEKRDEFMQELIEEQRNIMGRSGNGEDEMREKKKTMIQVLLTLQEKEPEYYTDEIIRGLMLDLLSAGTDTSVGSIEWALSLLLNNPEVLKKAQTEIDSYIGHQYRVINESDMASLPYLRCIINETMRMYPAGPLLVPHESSEESMIGGFRIQSGTMLLVNMWAIQNDPKVWTDPRKFMPERFEDRQDGVKDGFNFKFLPFGFGRRRCPGEGLAMRMVGLALGSLIQCFDWERVNNEMVDMTEGAGLTLPKVQPLMVKCQPRLVMAKFLSQL